MAWLSAGTASAAPAASFGHAAHAPEGMTSLSEYVLQPPGGEFPPPDGEVDEGDTSTFEPDIGPTGAQPGDTQPPGLQPPGLQQPGSQLPGLQPPSGLFTMPDSSARLDSFPAFPGTNAAPIETIGAKTSYPTILSSGGGTQPAASKRGIFGLTPIALIVGLIAFHIVIVSVVVK